MLPQERREIRELLLASDQQVMDSNPIRALLTRVVADVIAVRA